MYPRRQKSQLKTNRHRGRIHTIIYKSGIKNVYDDNYIYLSINK